MKPHLGRPLPAGLEASSPHPRLALQPNVQSSRVLPFLSAASLTPRDRTHCRSNHRTPRLFLPLGSRAW
ncbi:unnamed protein product [Chondrus crispus]|uniref:Uncharacterized protein n=1 Tax=Chondrus crispus TaxID=2769 RepID=R7QHW6_CHOCR|nr:unnamed protein product [Chondrus crispus]CDF36990.1 unnamed protein product [Chondrus crispus]|eukprot:XP_005716809.1 unnamed protein product [Chondrus crispus]